MLHKWKIILGNWINCYFEEDNKKEFPVTLDSLVNIISHLRENFNLDESKSALLDAHTIQEFLLEKYPSFRFENGTVEPINEEEIYMAASLLLFFVCINSKDVDIKSAMCNKLSGSDQKTILKFTKSLMECSNISSLDVLNAIAEACGQDVAASEIDTFKVAETPPALRSLHSEVRRLQAALDAERFDRNYLQEELARTNLKMEKLLKDKEQYKQDIVNLKAKISCCGQQDESKAETSSTNSAKLSKQLEETEERLVSVQERLDDVQYERDVYKNKLDELKHERDKWFTISQQESNRVAQLVDELETERHHVHSLKELVTELRQHNRLNGLDSSQLECDDLDTSVQSLPHNTSVCSEACANVIEVQLSEERAKIVLLKQQMQMLQDQLNDLTKKSEEEQRNLTHIISEKDTDIFNLKHRINEEIEDKNALKVHYDNEVTKLNNEVNELEQRLRDTGENSRRIIDSKMKEIQTLQEEKMSLLQSLSDEITKFDNIIKDLKADIDSEKTSKLKMREEYEKQMMKLKEKVSNRNNELVELQNKIFEKGEMIEILQCDLRKEKEVSNKYNNDVKNLTSQIQAYENDLRQKSEEVSELQKQIQQYTMYNEQLDMDLQHVSSCLAKSNEDCKVIEEQNSKLKVELQNRDVKIEKIQKDIEAQEIINIEEKKKLQYNLDEINATVDALKTQLQNEIEYKIQIQNELEEVKIANNKLSEDINQSNSKLNKIIANNKDLEKLLTEEKEISDNLKQKCAELKNTVEQLKIDVIEKDYIITLTKKDLDETKTHFDEQCVKMNELIDSFKIKLKLERSENNDMKQKLDFVKKEKMDLAVAISEKDNIGSELLMEIETLTHKAKENEIIIKNLEDNLSEKTKTLENVRIDFDVETNKLMTKINDMDKTLKELQLTSNNTIQSKDLEIDKLKLDIEKLQSTLQTEEEKIMHVDNEKTNLIQQLDEVNVYKEKMEKEYLNKCALLNSLNNELNDEIAHKNEKIDKLQSELENVLQDNKTKIEEIKTLKLNIEQACENSKELCDKKDSDIKELCLKIENLEALLASSQEELKVVVDNNDQLIKSLQKENIQLHHTIEKDNSTHELLIKEKEKVIKTLEIELKHKANMLNQLQNDFEHEKLTWEQLKLDTQEQISIKNDQIKELTQKALINQAQLEEKEVILKAMDAQINSLREEKIRLNNEIDSLRNTYNESAYSNDVLKDNLNKEKVEKENLEIKTQYLTQENQALSQKIDQIEDSYKKVIYERDSLLNEKAILVQQLMEEKSILKIADEGKEALLLEKRKVEEQLKDLQETINTLVQEKECLTQQLVDERLSKELAEKEKESLTIVKVELEDKLNEETFTRAQLIGKIESLSKEIENITKDKEHKNFINTELQKDVCNLKQKINILGEENKYLTIETESLKRNLLEYEKNQELLMQEKTALANEKETLTDCLDKLRLDCEKLKSENMALEEKVQEITNTWSSEVNSKQEQIKQMSIDLNSLKSDYKTLAENNSKIFTVLNCGLNKVIDSIKRDEVCSKILEKYGSVVKENTLENCDIIFKIISDLSSELNLKKNLEKALEDEDLVIKELSEKVKQKEAQISQLEIEVQNLKKVINDSKTESIKQKETYTSLLNTKTQDIQQLKIENDSLNHELNDLKQQLDVKVHSLKDKLEDNENLTEKLKKTYDCQIDNLNMMVSKLTNYLKEKSMELESVRNEKEKLQSMVEENNTVLKSLEEELKAQKQNQEKLITDFESESQVLNNMVSVTESMMEDQKVNLNRIISEHVKTNETLENEVKILKDALENEKTNFDIKLKEKEDIFNNNIEKLNMELVDLHKENDTIKKDFVLQNEVLKNKIIELEDNIVEKAKHIETIMNETKKLNEKTTAYEIKTKEYEQNVVLLEEKNNEIISNNAAKEVEIVNKMQQLKNELEKLVECSNKLNTEIENKSKENGALHEKIWKLEDQILNLEKVKRDMETEKVECLNKIDEFNTNLEKFMEENKVLKDIKNENLQLLKVVDEKDLDIAKLEKRLELELDRQKQINEQEKINLVNKCAILEEYQQKAEMELESRQKEIGNLQEEIKTLTLKTQERINEKDRLIVQVKEEKDAMINALNEQLNKEKQDVDNIKTVLELKQAEVLNLKNELDQKNQEDNIVQILRKENEELIKVIGQRETFAATSQERSGPKYSGQVEKERDHQQQVVSTSSDTHSSMESYKTITDLEKIVQDKNRTITTLQSDITYLKSIIAESENNLLDVSKELELSKENCQQLSSQLKKIVYQKNEEIAELRKQVAKMSVTENRASQIIKVSAKYQAIILKRIAEIKSNTVLKELTNFGNSNCDNDIRRSITAGTITMEDLENFLETTERHIRRCSDKQIALQKERDRLAEINRISESEIINMRKFLTELSVSMKTFNSVKDLYTQKLSRVVSIQRTVRREILSLDGRVNDATMCKLERGYAAVIQDLAECTMNLERWIERCVSRTISPEKIKQAFTSDADRISLASGTFQNTSLEVQIEELQKSFEKLLEDVSRAQKGEGAKDTQSITVMEVRAEYEDKLNRMKAKMKQLYQEQIAVFRENQKKEIAGLEMELQKTQDKLKEYEDHIKSLTAELWKVGEKFLVKKDEADWLKKKQRSGSLMSLQHVHSSGLVPPLEEPSRPSDACSLRSLPVTNQREDKTGRALQMSDEEGEVFDNRWLRELGTPARAREPARRLSELRWRNSLCPPHLKSSYPAETQFAPALQEEDIKCTGAMSLGGKSQRKEVGITAYKKPGPPTPSKQAGRLSATDSELRESLRVETEPGARKTSTPSRIRSLFRSNKNDTAEGTPRSRRLSNMFRKK